MAVIDIKKYIEEKERKDKEEKERKEREKKEKKEEERFKRLEEEERRRHKETVEKEREEKEWKRKERKHKEEDWKRHEQERKMKHLRGAGKTLNKLLIPGSIIILGYMVLKSPSPSPKESRISLGRFKPLSNQELQNVHNQIESFRR